MRSLLENSGDIHICQRQCLDNGLSCDSVDRKLDLLAGELQCSNVSVVGIQEIKWFGTDVWPATEGYTMLHSRQPAPCNGAVVARREGVGLVLDTRATAAWRAAGEVWKPARSRVIMARLKWTCQWWQRSGETFINYYLCLCPNYEGSS